MPRFMVRAMMEKNNYSAIFAAFASGGVCLSTGMGGHYVLDKYGDRDVNFTIIYTSALTEKVVCCCFVSVYFCLIFFYPV